MSSLVIDRRCESGADEGHAPRAAGRIVADSDTTYPLLSEKCRPPRA